VRALGLAKQLSVVRGCRGIGKRHMKLNDALPKLEIDPETYEVRADGIALTCEPATTLPLSQRYSLF
jgi:urease subunit alpha